MQNINGIILKGIGGFYYVAAYDGIIYECRARGLFRLDGVTPLAGDKVRISVTGHMTQSGLYPEGFVEEILPRINAFDRPPCANVELLVLVAAAKDPAPSFDVIDRFLVSASSCGADIAVCVSKSDLLDEETREEFTQRYGSIYPLIFVSAEKGEGNVAVDASENMAEGAKSMAEDAAEGAKNMAEDAAEGGKSMAEGGIEELRALIKGRQVALAGASGVGKSTLTNLLLGEHTSVVGEISEKTARGKNTTRHTELFRGDGFWLFDTPGFTSFDVIDMEEEDLVLHFPEFAPYLGKCRFSNCTHISEPDCAIRAGVRCGAVNKKRYLAFKAMYLELKEKNQY